MSFLVIGTNHKICPIGLREKLAFSRSMRKDALFLLKERGALNGAVIVSTCNRTEIYASTDDAQGGMKEIIDFVAGYRGINEKEILPHLYIYKGKDALKHLSEVCVGLDSLIIGELQILGQVKAAFGESEKSDFLDPLLKDAFYAAMNTANMVRKKTKISEGKVSVGSVTVDFIKQKKGPLIDKNIIIVGVGKVTELVLSYLKNEGSRVTFVSNRTIDKAKDLASQIGAHAVRLDDIREFIDKTDVLITATASPHYIINKDMLKFLRKKLLIVDLAVPRDVNPDVEGLKTVELYSFEDLDAVIKKNEDKKAKEVEKASYVINKELEKIWIPYLESQLEPALLP